MKFKVVGAALVALSLNAVAANISTTTKITKMYTYGVDTGTVQNDIAIKVANPITGCEDGFWIKSTDTLNNQSIVAFLLSAFHAGSNVYFAGYTDQRWPGSPAGAYCKVHSVGLEQ